VQLVRLIYANAPTNEPRNRFGAKYSHKRLAMPDLAQDAIRRYLARPMTKPKRMAQRRAHVNRGLKALPSKPLATTSRETFAQLVAKGMKPADAYRQAGYSGKDDARRDLRAAPDVDARITWLIEKRIEDDTRARHKADTPIADSRARLIRELERLAFADPRDLVQWRRQPILDDEGYETGQFQDVMTVTPSDRLTADQAASIRSVTTKSGALKFDIHDKVAALEKLAKVLGIYQDAAPVSQSLTVNQLNFNGDNALEAARRLAFALAKAQQAGIAAPLTLEHAPAAERKE
jgi:Terminase small subunit